MAVPSNLALGSTSSSTPLHSYSTITQVDLVNQYTRGFQVMISVSFDEKKKNTEIHNLDVVLTSDEGILSKVLHQLCKTVNGGRKKKSVEVFEQIFLGVDPYTSGQPIACIGLLKGKSCLLYHRKSIFEEDEEQNLPVLPHSLISFFQEEAFEFVYIGKGGEGKGKGKVQVDDAITMLKRDFGADINFNKLMELILKKEESPSNQDSKEVLKESRIKQILKMIDSKSKSLKKISVPWGMQTEGIAENTILVTVLKLFLVSQMI